MHTAGAVAIRLYGNSDSIAPRRRPVCAFAHRHGVREAVAPIHGHACALNAAERLTNALHAAADGSAPRPNIASAEVGRARTPARLPGTFIAITTWLCGWLGLACANEADPAVTGPDAAPRAQRGRQQT